MLDEYGQPAGQTTEGDMPPAPQSPGTYDGSPETYERRQPDPGTAAAAVLRRRVDEWIDIVCANGGETGRNTRSGR